MEMREKIKALRKHLGVKQDRFAELAGVAQSTVSRWEKHGAIPEPDQLKRLAEMAGKTLDEFMADHEDGSDSAPPQQDSPIADSVESAESSHVPDDITVAGILSAIAEDDGGLYAHVSQHVMDHLRRLGVTDEKIIRKGVALTYHKLAKDRR